jgi:hypothetical protein
MLSNDARLEIVPEATHLSRNQERSNTSPCSPATGYGDISPRPTRSPQTTHSLTRSATGYDQHSRQLEQLTMQRGAVLVSNSHLDGVVLITYSGSSHGPAATDAYARLPRGP